MNLTDKVDLIARLPTVMRKYDEIVQITDSQNPEFEFVWDILEWMYKQIFIVTAEEYGLQRFERLLGLTPLEGETFDARRKHILVRWHQETPYTMRFIISLLEMLTDGSFEIFTNFNEYEMEIRVFTLNSSIISDLAFIVRYIIPANLVITSSNHIYIDLTGYIKVGAAINTVKEYNITQDFNATIEPAARIAVSASTVSIVTYDITQ